MVARSSVVGRKTSGTGPHVMNIRPDDPHLPVRAQLAGQILRGFCSNSAIIRCKSDIEMSDFIVKQSVELADLLIDKLNRDSL